jgi:hypothetical protein
MTRAQQLIVSLFFTAAGLAGIMSLIWRLCQ